MTSSRYVQRTHYEDVKKVKTYGIFCSYVTTLTCAGVHGNDSDP